MFNIQSGVFFHDCENDIKLLRVRLLQRAKMFWTANKLFKALYNYNFDQRSSSYPQCWSILNETNICSTEKADISFADTWEKCCVPHFDTQVWKSKKYFFKFTQPTPAHMITFLANTAIHVFCIQ